MYSTYHKIETLYERDEVTHKLKEPLLLKNPIYGALRDWHWTEKIDGTNIRCLWDQAQRKVTFGGRSDNAQIHADLVKWLYENVREDRLVLAFPEVDAVIYGEGYGAGIQKGGNYSPTKKFIIFDVFIVDTVNSRLGGWWLNWDSTVDVCDKLELDKVPFVGQLTLDEASQFVRHGFGSFLPGATAPAEGLVGRPVETLYDKKGHRLITKLKTKDFASEARRAEPRTRR